MLFFKKITFEEYWLVIVFNSNRKLCEVNQNEYRKKIILFRKIWKWDPSSGQNIVSHNNQILLYLSAWIYKYIGTHTYNLKCKSIKYFLLGFSPETKIFINKFIAQYYLSYESTHPENSTDCFENMNLNSYLLICPSKAEIINWERIYLSICVFLVSSR